jgi:hypothetical protein
MNASTAVAADGHLSSVTSVELVEVEIALDDLGTPHEHRDDANQRLRHTLLRSGVGAELGFSWCYLRSRPAVGDDAHPVCEEAWAAQLLGLGHRLRPAHRMAAAAVLALTPRAGATEGTRDDLFLIALV